MSDDSMIEFDFLGDRFTPLEMEWIKRIDSFTSAYPQTEWGPGHLVLSDYNLECHHLDYCLKECETLLNGTQPFSEYPVVSHDDVITTQKFLLEMKAALYAD